MTPPKDFRAFVQLLDAAGELATISREVDWDLEMGAISRRCYETGAPAPLFQSVRGAAGLRAISAPMSESAVPRQRFARIALSLGLPAAASAAEIIDTMVAARNRAPIKPVIVDDAPCKQNIRRGDELDIMKLPLPLLHHGDGGRYLNTLGMIVTRTPDGAWTSWSIARIMALDARRAVGIVAPFQHIGKVQAQWRKLRKDMPVALVFGMDPVSTYAAGMPLPENYDEVDYVGAFRGRPVETVRCETIDLEVPANAEIVLEGRLSIRDVELEGPFAEEAGYIYPAYPVPQPVYHFDAMTFRDDAIYPFTCSGEPPEEDHTVWGVAMSAEATHMFRAAGLPVTTAWSPFETSNGWLVVAVADTWRDLGMDGNEFSRRVGQILYSTKVGDMIKTVIVVEDDIDPTNLRELVWALDGRNERGSRGQIRVPNINGWPGSPYVNPDPTTFPDG
ncbi:UbiD family decarboxylase [Nocardia sp. NPDC005825]|uniref:UbiD family decarboxylase n=1 Tax=unclassified Nocardia TaxID=2637762 RepID=UPI003400B140